MKLNIAICDDERSALKAEVDVIESVLDERHISYSLDLFLSPLDLIKSDRIYNIIFLDVEMDSLNGIEVAERLREENKNCLIFFVTNHEAYLDDAFNQHAFRFWTKPIDRRKLMYGMASAIREIETSEHRLTVTVGMNKIKMSTRNIIYIYAQNRRLHIITTKGEIITNDLFEDVRSQLKDSIYFCEPHRSYLVNLEYVRNYDKDKIYCLYKDKIYEVYLSRRKYDSFNKRFIEWIGEK